MPAVFCDLPAQRFRLARSIALAASAAICPWLLRKPLVSGVVMFMTTVTGGWRVEVVVDDHLAGDPFDTILLVGREIERREQHGQVVAPQGQAVLLESDAHEMNDGRLDSLQPRRLVTGDDFDAASSGLISERGLEDRPVRLPDERPRIVEAQQIVRASFTIDRHLDEVALVAFVRGPDPVEDVDMDMGGARELLDGRHESVEGDRIPTDNAPGLGHVPGPHPAPTPVLGEPDLLGMAEPVLRVDEHPQRSLVRIAQAVEEGAIRGNAVERRLPRLVRERGSAARGLE